jgi:phosphoenolpyruvate carboxylase
LKTCGPFPEFQLGQCRLTPPGWYGFAPRSSVYQGWRAAQTRKRHCAAAKKYKQWPFSEPCCYDMVLASDLALMSHAKLVDNARLRKRILQPLKPEWHRTASARWR